MGDFENLTDAQLRTKLLEHGFPIMPITGTTRKIMIKKLKLLTESKSKSHATERKTLAKFSSDDDSDRDTKEMKTRRATAAPSVGISLQANGNRERDKRSVKLDKSLRRDEGRDLRKDSKKSRVVVEVRHLSGDVSSDTEPELATELGRKSKRREPAPRNEVEDGELDDTEEENSLGINMQNMSSVSNASSLSMDSPPKLFTTEPRRHTSSVQRPKPIVAPVKSRYSAFKTTLTRGEQASSTSTPGENEYDYDEYENVHRSPQPAYGYLTRNALGNEDLLASAATPYLRNFRKRLPDLTSTEVRSDAISSRFKRLISNGVVSSTEPSFFLRTKQKLSKYIRFDFHRRITNTTCRSPTATALKGDENKGNFISLALVAAVGVFFAIILALYYGMHRGINTNDIVGLKVPYCSPSMSINCLTPEEAEGGIDLYKIFKPKLIELAIDYQCGDLLSGQTSRPASNKQKKMYMTDNDIVQFIKHNYKLQDEDAIIQDVDNFVLIAHYNQFLGVSVLKVDKNGGDAYTVVEDIKHSNKELESEDSNYIRALAVLTPTLPWKCSFWQTIATLLKAVFIIFSVAGLLYLSKFGYKWFRYYQHKRKEEVVMLVEKIVEIMQTQAEDDQFLVINHIRDMIIPIDSRKKMEQTWKKAISFINENESRIRTEVQVVKGESYEVWRWIGGHNVSMSGGSPSAKSWQGQAFEVQAGGVNAPPCSPTPCLKIRGMIDDADRGCNKAAIRDAILAKCGPQCRVLHVAVDVQSKCVYLKCADTGDAAIAYRNLHGQWFAGHLVTVKYLRLERYMQRFPDSAQSGPPFLKVGNN